MSFTIRKAARSDVKIIGGLAGPSGGGKTLTALLLARGLAGPEGGIVVIDTEHGRSQIYADDPRVAPWDWMDFQPPFSPERYVEALEAAEAASPAVVVVDSISHEHEGEGGLMSIQEQFLQDRAGDDARKREALSFTAWNAAKARHKKLLLHLVRMPCHVLVCMRAQDKIELVKEGGKLKAVPKQTMRGAGLDGWVPICERRLPFEMTFSFMFLPDQPGYPRPLKPMPDSMAPLVSLDRPIGVDTGQRLAEWSRAENSDQPVDRSDAPKLTSELLDLAAQLGKRDEVATAIANNRRDHSTDMLAHVKWLRAQIRNARAKVSAAANKSVAV